MSLAIYSLGEPSIAQCNAKYSGKKAPPKRSVRALADRKMAPEPR